MAVFASAAAARLPVRAVLPQGVTWSGRKTSMAQADMQRYQHRVPGETTGSSYYVFDEHTGDSVIVNKHFRGTQTVKTDTVKVRE